MPEPAVTDRDLWNELQPLLDQELTRLSEKNRVAIVLCDLEGKTRKEAARQLGVPEGTLAARLARGRRVLAQRLARHGLAVSGVSLAAVLAQHAAASAPTSVVVSTIKAAGLFAAGQAAATGAISVKVAALTDGVLRSMLYYKLKVVSVLLAALVACVGAGMCAAALCAGDPAQPPPAEKAPDTGTDVTQAAARPQDKQRPEPGAKGEPRAPLVVDVEGPVYDIALSPNGGVVATVTSQSKDDKDYFGVELWDSRTGKRLQELLEETTEGRARGTVGGVAYSPDGKTVAVVSLIPVGGLLKGKSICGRRERARRRPRWTWVRRSATA
jgi:predicted DNA-binding protein (UPF0251 family)